MDRLDRGRADVEDLRTPQGQSTGGLPVVDLPFREPSACTPARIRTWSRPLAFRRTPWPGTCRPFQVVTPGGQHHQGFVPQPDQHDRVRQLGRLPGGSRWRTARTGRGTAVFITFDDCGCFYDQVPPPKANRTARQEGPRMPLIIVSPVREARLHRRHAGEPSHQSLLTPSTRSAWPRWRRMTRRRMTSAVPSTTPRCRCGPARMVTRSAAVLGATPPPDPGHAGRSNLAQQCKPRHRTGHDPADGARRVRDGGHRFDGDRSPRGGSP